MKKIETLHLKPSELKHDFGNPRKCSKEKIEELKKSLEQFGDHDIIKINEKNEIISGHQRIKAMIDLNIDTPILCKKLIGYTKKELKKINIDSNEHVGEWDYDLLSDWKDDIKDLDFMFKKDKGIREGWYNKKEHYNLESEGEIEYKKILYRLEACNYVKKNSCLELFAGKGQLTYWYRRLFKNIDTVDKRIVDNIKYNKSALDFIKNDLNNNQYDYVDFDDEGCPFVEIQEFFKRYLFEEKVVIAITDGIGMSLKVKTPINLYKYYKIGKDEVKSSNGLYSKFEGIFREGVDNIFRKTYNKSYKEISLYRKQNGNCIYACYLINPE